MRPGAEDRAYVKTFKPALRGLTFTLALLREELESISRKSGEGGST